ncbi:hypothetical protein PI126_g22052 [Phytophthora idaei]|nr:hypothetical protein PI126_g22052 [Phytophthora idaei]
MTDWRAMTDAMEATSDAPMPLAGQYEWDTLAELQPEGHTNWCVEVGYAREAGISQWATTAKDRRNAAKGG